jgi:hypothetical protein
MIAKRYRFSGSTANGDIIYDQIRYNHERGYVALTFFSDSALTTQVTPTAGSVVAKISENGALYGSIENGNINASFISIPRPNWSGSIRFVKLTFADIAGGDYFQCDVSMFGGS